MRRRGALGGRGRGRSGRPGVEQPAGLTCGSEVGCEELAAPGDCGCELRCAVESRGGLPGRGDS